MKKTKYFQKKNLLVILLALMLILSLTACQTEKPAPVESTNEQPATDPVAEEKSIILATPQI